MTLAFFKFYTRSLNIRVNQWMTMNIHCLTRIFPATSKLFNFKEIQYVIMQASA